jgi:hypothetical protein
MSLDSCQGKEITRPSETSVPICEITYRRTPEYSNLRSRGREISDLKNLSVFQVSKKSKAIP